MGRKKEAVRLEEREIPAAGKQRDVVGYLFYSTLE